MSQHPEKCRKSEMVRQRSGMVERAHCRLPYGHQGAHTFADSTGDVQTQAWKPDQSVEAYLRLARRSVS